ncbi:MAG: sporulation protein YabP [Clostridia bacterium]|nr:sporulation protein YabP [Clostridia bacterium]
MAENTIHNVILEGRKKVSVSGVQDMECFDDGRVVVYTSMGVMEIKGINFHMNKLSLDSGEIIVEGDIDSIVYEDVNAPATAKKGLISKIFG